MRGGLGLERKCIYILIPESVIGFVFLMPELFERLSYCEGENRLWVAFFLSSSSSKTSLCTGVIFENGTRVASV